MTDSNRDPGAAGGRVTILQPETDDVALVPLRYRFDGFTALKQCQFITVLGQTGCVRDACRDVGISSTTAYKARARSPQFAAEWDRALAMAATVLEHVAFERAVIGIEEPVWWYGKQVGTRRRYSDSILRMLVLRGDLRPHPSERRASREETDARLKTMLDALAQRTRREERIRAEAEADRLLAAGLTP